MVCRAAKIDSGRSIPPSLFMKLVYIYLYNLSIFIFSIIFLLYYIKEVGPGKGKKSVH
jgi:hypothetical protein